MIKIALLAAAIWFFELWPFSVGAPLDFQTEYIPEVIYLDGNEDKTWLGPRLKGYRDLCLELAHDQSKRIAGANPTRVRSVACRIMRGERFLSRAK
jgi:hypothetical protein